MIHLKANYILIENIPLYYFPLSGEVLPMADLIRAPNESGQQRYCLTMPLYKLLKSETWTRYGEQYISLINCLHGVKTSSHEENRIGLQRFSIKISDLITEKASETNVTMYYEEHLPCTGSYKIELQEDRKMPFILIWYHSKSFRENPISVNVL